MASGKLVWSKAFVRTRSHRMKFCVQGGLGDTHNKQRKGAGGYPWALLRFLYKGIIIKHNKTEPTYTKTSLFLCEKRRFFMGRTEKGGKVF